MERDRLLVYLFVVALVVLWILWSMYADRGEQLEDVRGRLSAARAQLDDTFRWGHHRRGLRQSGSRRGPTRVVQVSVALLGRQGPGHTRPRDVD